MKALFYILIAFLSGSSFAQDKIMTASEFQKELQVIQKAFSASNTEIHYTRELLIADEDTTMEAGVFVRGNGLDYRLEQNGALIIQNKTGKLHIDSVNHIVVLTIVDSLFSMMNTPDLTDANVARVYLLSKSASKSNYTYRMTPNIEGVERAQLTVPVNGTTPLTMRIELPPGNYVSNTMDDISLEEPVMTVVYTKIKNVKPANSVFSFDKYLTSENGKYALKGFSADYIFHDLRPNTTKQN